MYTNQGFWAVPSINKLVGVATMTYLERIRTAVVTESPLKPQMVVFSTQLSLINQLIRTWQNDSDMIKLLKVLSKKVFEFLSFSLLFFFLDNSHSQQSPAWRQNKAILNFQQ